MYEVFCSVVESASEFISAAPLTGKEYKIFAKTGKKLEFCRKSLKKILKSGEKEDSENCKAVLNEFKQNWDHFKEKVLIYSEKDPILTCDDIIPTELESINSKIKIILDSSSESGKIQRKFRETFSSFSELTESFLRAIHKKGKDKDKLRRLFISEIKTIMTQTSSDFEVLFTALKDSSAKEEIHRSLRLIKLVANKISKEPIKGLPDIMNSADEALTAFLNNNGPQKEKDIEKIEQKLKNYEEENKKLEIKKSALEKSINSSNGTSEEQIESYLSEQLQSVESEINKVKEKKRSLRHQMTNDSTSFSSLRELYSQREVKEEKKPQNVDVTASDLLSKKVEMETELEKLIKENEELCKQKESISYDNEYMKQKVSDANETKERTLNEIKNLEEENQRLKEEEKEMKEMYKKAAKKCKNEELVEIMNELVAEMKEINDLEQREEFLNEEIIKNTSSLDIANAELSRATDVLYTVKANSIIASIEALQKEIEDNNF